MAWFRMVYFFILMILFSACTNFHNRRLHQTLKAAGENKGELEKVLERVKRYKVLLAPSGPVNPTG